MRNKVVVHPKYATHKQTLLQILKNFDALDDIVVQGERNTIKKIPLEGTMLTIKKFKNPNVFQSLGRWRLCNWRLRILW